MKWLLLGLLQWQLDSATLDPRSLEEFRKYMARADQEMMERARPGASPRLGAPLEPAIAPWLKDNPVEIPKALIHDLSLIHI